VLRVTGIVAIVAPSVLGVAGLALLAAASGFAACGAMFLARGQPPGANAELPQNPFELRPLLAFAVFFAVILTISAAVSKNSTGGMVVTSAVSGTFDVDVAVLSALRLLGDRAPLEAVGHAVLLALVANAVGRLALAVISGPIRFWLPIAAATIVAGTLGFLAFAMLPHFEWAGPPLVLGLPAADHGANAL
jgi:uncharacterized membrane protein (DUF4010 family)